MSVFGWLVRRRLLAAWEMLANGDIDALPLPDDMRFAFAGDHSLATDLHSGQEVRDWLHALFARFPGLSFEVADVLVYGPPWALRTAARYTATQDGQTLYRGVQWTRSRWGRDFEEWVLPDTQAVARLTE